MFVCSVCRLSGRAVFCLGLIVVTGNKKKHVSFPLSLFLCVYVCRCVGACVCFSCNLHLHSFSLSKFQFGEMNILPWKGYSKGPECPYTQEVHD